MKIIAYQIHENPMDLRPGDKIRQWMEESPNKYAYRCLPLSIGNSTGYDVFMKSDVMISWNGGAAQADIQINYEDSSFGEFASSSFGMGIITFHPGWFIKTSPEWDMLFTGPINESHPGAFPLSGVVETAWLEFTATINWKLTTIGTHLWKKETPIARLIPIPHLFEIEAEKKILEKAEPELFCKYVQKSALRNQKIVDVNEAYKTGKDFGTVKVNRPTTEWDKEYYRGIDTDGKKVYNHNTKRNFPPFKES